MIFYWQTLRQGPKWDLVDNLIWIFWTLEQLTSRSMNPVYLEILGCWMEASLDFEPQLVMAWINSNESGSRGMHQCCVAEIVMKVLDLQRGAWWKKWWCRLRVVIHLHSPPSGQYTLHKTSDDRALCINQAFKLFQILLFVLSGDRRGRHLSRFKINISKHFLRRQHFQIFKPIVSLHPLKFGKLQVKL